MKFRPIGERALVKVEAREEKAPSGIVLPETAKDKPQTARIIVVGISKMGVWVRGISWSSPGMPASRSNWTRKST